MSGGGFLRTDNSDLCLTIDGTEKNSKKFMMALRRSGVAHTFVGLPVGDIVCGDVVFERKEIADFYNGIMDGRLFRQVVDMKANFPNAYLVIIGSFESYVRMVRFKKLPFFPKVEVFDGALASLAAKYDIKILPADNNSEYLRLVLKILNLTSSDGAVFVKKNKSSSLTISMLSQIKGFSFKISERIEKEYTLALIKKSDMEQLPPVSIETLKNIDGIGNSRICMLESAFSVQKFK